MDFVISCCSITTRILIDYWTMSATLSKEQDPVPALPPGCTGANLVMSYTCPSTTNHKSSVFPCSLISSGDILLPDILESDIGLGGLKRLSRPGIDANVKQTQHKGVGQGTDSSRVRSLLLRANFPVCTVVKYPREVKRKNAFSLCDVTKFRFRFIHRYVSTHIGTY